MTVIRLDAATLAKFEAAQGRVMLADESGTPVRVCVLPPVPMAEPDLPPEEWERRAKEPGGMTTAQMLEFLRNVDTR
jgi:hypothetical protein